MDTNIVVNDIEYNQKRKTILKIGPYEPLTVDIDSRIGERTAFWRIFNDLYLLEIWTYEDTHTITKIKMVYYKKTWIPNLQLNITNVISGVPKSASIVPTPKLNEDSYTIIDNDKVLNAELHNNSLVIYWDVDINEDVNELLFSDRVGFLINTNKQIIGLKVHDLDSKQNNFLKTYIKDYI